MLVRVINRKGNFVDRHKMIYPEIQQCEQQLDQLKSCELLRPLQSDDVPNWLTSLTKAQLFALIIEQSTSTNVKKSHSKSMLLDYVIQFVDRQSCLSSDVASSYLVDTTDLHIHYFLFLFFGHLGSRLDQFSMRDMGIRATRKDVTTSQARFENKQQSNSAYYYAKKLQEIKSLDSAHFPCEQLRPEQHMQAIGERANQLRDKYFYVLGKMLLTNHHSLALNYLEASSNAKAQEKWLREQYKIGNKSLVKARLEKIIDTSLDDTLLLFAEDFYQRKFQQIKVSKLTQKLRKESYSLTLDQIYKDQVEKGVQQHYQRLGCIVFRTENRLFNTLFGLLFWQELFHQQPNSVANEFDRRPKVIKNNTVYAELGAEIENRLALMAQPDKAVTYITKIATSHYGQPNGMFHWHPKMMQIITLLIQTAPTIPLVNHLRAKAKNFVGLNDGYPDLLIIENGALRFVEVKAQGDAIRPNQFVTINALQQAGFDVQICRVDWCVDPLQPYVVVDIETTGGKSSLHRITEIGAVKIVDGNEVDSWSTLINPQRQISKFITRLTGINNEMVEDAPLFCEIADSFSDFVQGCVFVAHNVNFDYGFIKQEYQRIDRKFSMPKMCTVRESRKYFNGLSSYSLANLCRHFDIPLTSHHRALCDAQATAQLWQLIDEQKHLVSATN
jgi:DNA polymerase-3 subunit epsilon